MYKDKKILVAGGTGLIGTPLVHQLRSLGADVLVVSTDSDERAMDTLGSLDFFERADLTELNTCCSVVSGFDMVFNLIAVKSSTQMASHQLARAYFCFLSCNTNLMEAAYRSGIERFMFVGSIGQYPNIPIRHEDSVWDGPPQANDRYMGIAKRAGEAQAETYFHDSEWKAVRIVRLSNVYGPFDDFGISTGRVIPALINRMCNGENPVNVAGDGTAIRDFIYSHDVVDGMLLAMEHLDACFPVNLGNGRGCSIAQLAEVIANCMPTKPKIKWDTSRPSGDSVRILDTKRAKELLNFEAPTSLEDGIAQTVEWYNANQKIADRREKELHGS